MKQFIFTPPVKGGHKQPVALITKRSNGDCLVLRRYISRHTGRWVTKHFWTHKNNLSQPDMVSTQPKNRPGVKTGRIKPTTAKTERQK